MINWKDLKDPEFWEDKKKYFKALNNLLIRYFKWFVVLLVVIILVIGFFSLLKPKYEETVSLLESSQKKQKELFQQKREKLKELKGVIDSYNKITPEQKKRVKMVLPERKNQEELFTELKQLVKENHLTLKSLSIKKGNKGTKKDKEREVTNRKGNKQEEDQAVEVINRKTPEGVEKIKMEMSVFGSNYNSFKELLETLEKNLPLIDVVKVDFASGGSSLHLTLETYQLK